MKKLTLIIIFVVLAVIGASNYFVYSNHDKAINYDLKNVFIPKKWFVLRYKIDEKRKVFKTYTPDTTSMLIVATVYNKITETTVKSLISDLNVYRLNFTDYDLIQKKELSTNVLFYRYATRSDELFYIIDVFAKKLNDSCIYLYYAKKVSKKNEPYNFDVLDFIVKINAELV